MNETEIMRIIKEILEIHAKQARTIHNIVEALNFMSGSVPVLGEGQ